MGDRRILSGGLGLPRLVSPDQEEAFSGLIAGRLVISRLVRLRAGWRPSLFPLSLVLGAALWRWVRVPPPDKLDQTARGGQVQA